VCNQEKRSKKKEKRYSCCWLTAVINSDVAFDFLSNTVEFFHFENFPTTYKRQLFQLTTNPIA